MRYSFLHNIVASDLRRGRDTHGCDSECWHWLDRHFVHRSTNARPPTTTIDNVCHATTTLTAFGDSRRRSPSSNIRLCNDNADADLPLEVPDSRARSVQLRQHWFANLKRWRLSEQRWRCWRVFADPEEWCRLRRPRKGSEADNRWRYDDSYLLMDSLVMKAPTTNEDGPTNTIPAGLVVQSENYAWEHADVSLIGNEKTTAIQQMYASIAYFFSAPCTIVGINFISFTAQIYNALHVQGKEKGGLILAFWKGVPCPQNPPMNFRLVLWCSWGYDQGTIRTKLIYSHRPTKTLASITIIINICAENMDIIQCHVVKISTANHRSQQG